MDVDMATHPTTAATEATGRTWLEIEGLVEEVARLAKQNVSSQQFYGELLDRAVRGIAAVGGAVWIRGAEGNLFLQCQINLAGAQVSQVPSNDPLHARLLQAVADGQKTQVFQPQSGTSAEDHIANTSQYLIVASPLIADGDSIGVLEVFQRPGGSPAAQRGYIELVEVLCELATDFHQSLELRELRDRAALWGQFDRFSDSIHAHLDLRRVAYNIANDARRLLDCDRVSVAVVRGRSVRMTAISGVDDVDRRANTVRLLEQLVRAVVKGGQPLWYSGADEELQPQIENILQPYLDLSHARSLAVIPLETSGDEKESGQTVGALVVEQFEAGRSDEAARKVASVVARHSASALGNALTYNNLPLLPVLRAIGSVRWFARYPQLPIVIGLLTLLAAAVAASIFVPADFRIGARGELQPAKRSIVFAPVDGVVERLAIPQPAIEDDDAPPVFVRADQVLIELRNSDLDFEQTRLIGERQTAAKQLDTVQVTRQATNANDPESRNRLSELTAKEEELKVLLSSYDRQLEVLALQREQLAVRSPLAGQVLTWNAEELLESRPVRRGQALLSVADVAGEWLLEMRVPDHHASHVLTAWREQGRDLEVEFKLKSDPSQSHRGSGRKSCPRHRSRRQR